MTMPTPAHGPFGINKVFIFRTDRGVTVGLAAEPVVHHPQSLDIEVSFP